MNAPPNAGGAFVSYWLEVVMDTADKSTNTPYLIVRWLARILSIPIMAIFLLMFFGEGFYPAKVTPIEWVMLLFGPFGLVVGMILGWWKEALGGVVVLVSFFVAMLVGDYSSSGAGYMLICASPGFLFLLSWFLSKSAVHSKEMPVGEEDLPPSPSSPNETLN